jgi:hypothetical protein
VRRFDTEKHAWEKSLSVQIAARELRYAWFKELARDKSYRSIATAHHFDDSMETILINLTRGTGLDGLTGIPVRNGIVIRPMLFASRKQVERYADQQWLIYDTKRKYGLYYDKQQVDFLTMSFETETGSGKDIRNVYSEQEELYQKLWQRYFSSINIAARKNMKLHIQHMPRRYWKFLTEKIK